MSLFSFVTRYFNPEVTEDPKTGTVTIKYIATLTLLRDLNKVWKTGAFEAHMFNRMTKDSIEFYSFFVPDVVHAIAQILEYKNRNSKDSDLHHILDKLKSNTWYRSYFVDNGQQFDYALLKELKFTLLPPQLEAMNAYEKKVVPLHLNGYLLAASVGTGKTLMGLALTLLLKADTTIIVCPKYIIDTVWVDAIHVQFGDRKTYWRSNTNMPLTGDKDFYIFHYEALDKALQLVKKFHFKNPVIILDECHNLNDVKAQRTQIYLELCKASGSKNIIHESGTPISALSSEVTPLLRAIDPMFTKEVEARFKNIYNKSASRALEILANRMGLISHKIPKSAVMGESKPIRLVRKVQLPDAERYTLPYLKQEAKDFFEDRYKALIKEMPLHEKNYHEGVMAYTKMVHGESEMQAFAQYRNYIAEIRKGFDPYTMGHMSEYCNKFEKERILPLLSNEQKKVFRKSKGIYKYIELVIAGEFLGGILGRRRVECHSALIEHSGIDQVVQDAEKKTICFTDYVDTLTTAYQYFKTRGFEPIVIYADTNADVTRLLQKFKESHTVNPLIATIKSLSTGVTLIEANTVIFLNLPFRDKDYEQASARVFRIGQLSQVYLIDLVLDTGSVPNISTRLAEILSWSQDQVKAIMGGSGNAALPFESEGVIAVENFKEPLPLNESMVCALESIMVDDDLGDLIQPAPALTKPNLPKPVSSVLDW